jgi:hypothetical protein
MTYPFLSNPRYLRKVLTYRTLPNGLGLILDCGHSRVCESYFENLSITHIQCFFCWKHEADLWMVKNHPDKYKMIKGHAVRYNQYGYVDGVFKKLETP